jgi:magnesium-transporting ATPase (P-type)
MILNVLPDPWGALGSLLLLGVLGLLAYGFFAHPYDEERLARMPKRTELPQTVLLIALAALVWLSAAQGTPLATLALLVFLGVIGGFMGDLLMADVFHQENHVLYGMGAFALGHVAYMFGFREIALAFGLHNLGSYALALVIMWIAAFGIWYVLVRDPAGDPTLQRAALIYALFLASMAAYALGLAFQQAAFWPLALGALSFLISDSVLAAQLFTSRRFRHMGDLVWTTYIVAQALIVTAVPVALGLL